MHKQAVIIGAGLAGCFMAVCLARRGYNVEVYEKLTQQELTEEASARSFNLTFYNRGTAAFKKADLWEDVQPVLRVLEGCFAHSTDHPSVHSKFNTTDKRQHVVERPELLRHLIKATKKYPKIKLHFSTALVGINKWKKEITVQNLKTKKLNTISCDFIVGADGVNSLTRTLAHQGQDAHFSQEFLTWRYKQVRIPLKVIEQFGWDPKSEHFVHSQTGGVLIAFPNADKSYTGMFLLPEKGEHTFEKLTTQTKVMNFLKEQFPKQEVAFNLFLTAILNNPEGRLRTIDVNPWYDNDFIVLIGDAAHALLPFYGQGMSAAFEDCLALVESIEAYKKNLHKAFAIYQESRKKNTDVLANLSRDSMDRIAKYKHADINAINNRVDSILHGLFPRFWKPPIYQLVSEDLDEFHAIYKKHQKQRRISALLGISTAAYILLAALVIKEKVGESSHFFLEKTHDLLNHTSTALRLRSDTPGLS